MAGQFWVADTPGYQPVRADTAVKKGVVITGKVIDKATGKPLPGFALADALAGNPFAKDYPEFGRSANFRSWETDERDNFRVVAIPGPVLLMGGPDERRLPGGTLEALKYKPPLADAKYPQYFRHFADGAAYRGVGQSVSPLQGNFCKVLEIKPGTTTVKYDIVLERANALPVKIQDAGSQPVRGVWATGISTWNGERAVQLTEDSCSAYALERGKPRLMVFYDRGKKRAGSVMLKGDEKSAVVVKLGQLGSLKSQLLDGEGKPLARVVVEVHYCDRQAEEIDRVIHEATQIVTDASGSFTLDQLIPQLKFGLSFRRGNRRLDRKTKPAFALIQVKSGECRNLGAIALKRIPEKTGE